MHWLTRRKNSPPGRQDDVIPFTGSVVDSPRRAALVSAGWRTIARGHSVSSHFSCVRCSLLTCSLTDHSPPEDQQLDAEPFNTLVRAFSPYELIDRETYAPLIPYLTRMCIPAGTVLWKQDDPPDGLYIVEAGILRATYRFADPTPPMVESMVPGTIAGELSTLAGLERNATCVVERAAVLWKLSTENLERLEREQPELAGAFTRLILKGERSPWRVIGFRWWDLGRMLTTDSHSREAGL